MKNKKKLHDLTGQKFGRLTAIGIDERADTKRTYWVCACDCGNFKTVRSDILLSGCTRSCGCMKREQDVVNLDRTSHMMSGTRLYGIWAGIKKRCLNINDIRYQDYGGRGIKVCDEWKNSFETFMKWALNSGYQEDLTIDRIDNDGDYEPNNCRWATMKDQSNNRRSNIKITIGNATKTMTEWCKIFDLDYKMVLARYNRNGFCTLDELFKQKG